MNYKDILNGVQKQLSSEQSQARILASNEESIKAIAEQSKIILDLLEKDSVKKDLTQSWLQVKIDDVAAQMSILHDFLKYEASSDDNTYAADRPGLWENIRKKKEREGKKYKPAKPGDPDRPETKQWKKLT